MLWNRERGNHGASWALWCAPLPETALVLSAGSEQPGMLAQGRLQLTGEQLRDLAAGARRIAPPGPPSAVAFLGD